MSLRRYRKKQLKGLVTVEDIREKGIGVFKHDRENISSRLSDQAAMDISQFWAERYRSAYDITIEKRQLMSNFDKIYKGQWRDGEDTTNRIFLPKTREDLIVVFAFFISIIAQLKPLVEMEPLGTQVIWGIEEDYKRAKLQEAFVNYYMEEQWRFKDVALPVFLKHFLKYSLAIFKITYLERDWKSDLDIEVIDRAFLFLDPNPTQFRKQRWTIEEFYISRSYLYDMLDNSDWAIREKDRDRVENYQSKTPDDLLDRIFNTETRRFNTSVIEDDSIQCHECWQYPREGLPDNYTVFLGSIEDGIILRYGRNPFPYKGNPYVAASYDEDESDMDGTGFIEQQEQLQKVINTFLNLRLTDVRKNIQRSSIVVDQLVDTQTQQDMKDGNSIVRAAPEVLRWLEQSGKKISDLIAELPSGTSTKELLSMDLPYLQNQFQDSTNIRDLFKGVTPPAGTPLGTFQELLARSQGVFRPVIRNLMHVVETTASIISTYSRDEEFFGDERLIRIVGPNRYQDIIADWRKIGKTSFKSITPDMLDVDTTFNAVNGADAAIARTLLTNTMAETIQAIGQVPQLFEELKSEFDFAEIFSHIINVSNLDIESLRLTPKKKQQREMERQKQLQEAQRQKLIEMKQQAEFQGMLEEARALAQAKGKILYGQEDFRNQVLLNRDKEKQKFQTSSLLSDIDSANKIRQQLEQIEAQKLADEDLETLKFRIRELLMRLEAKLESQASVTNVGHDDYNITASSQS